MSRRARGYLKLKATAFLLSPESDDGRLDLRLAADTVLRLVSPSSPDARLARAAQAAISAADDKAVLARLQQALDDALQEGREASESEIALPYYRRGQYA